MNVTNNLNEFNLLSQSTDNWFCHKCVLPQFSDSFFSDINTDNCNADHSLNSSLGLAPDHEQTAWPNRGSTELVAEKCLDLRCTSKKNGIFAYLNVNSIRYKFLELKDTITNLSPILFGVAETKIDASYPDAQFCIPAYRIYRQDRSCNGGGLLCYVRSDTASRRVDISTKHIETVCLEITLNKTTWFIVVSYKPPKVTNLNFISDMHC